MTDTPNASTTTSAACSLPAARDSRTLPGMTRRLRRLSSEISLHHIRLDGRWILVRQISNRQHDKNLFGRRLCAASIPAMVNTSPFTN